MPVAAFSDVSLSVLFPAYNEVGNIERTLPQAVEALRAMVGRFEVIVIDDCSTDETYRVAGELARTYPEIRLEQNEVNLRQGATLARGFGLAKLDWVIESRPYLTGRDFGLADAAYLPWILRAETMLGVDLGPYAALADWVARARERPSVGAENALLLAAL